MEHKGIRLGEITAVLENFYPLEYAEDWDKVGIHFGNINQPVRKVMTSLDVRPAVVEEAIQKGVDTLIVHHPVIFGSIERFDDSTPDLRMYRQLIQHNINVYVMHTNVDRAWDGMNDWLAQRLSLNNVVALESEVPDQKPGLGRFGQLPKALSREDLIEHLKHSLQTDTLTIIEQHPKENYQSIAITGGSSFDSIYDALALKADVFITGDITYHKGHDAFEMDIMTVDPGHYIEQLFKEIIANYLTEISQRNAWDIEILVSETNTNPFAYE